MVDHEVENALREIRERVRAESRALKTDEASERVQSADVENPGAHLARIEAQLAVTARSHQRLPPLMSNREGAVARIELWVKKLIKRAAHWFTWEQVNFNTAVHHALRDALEALTEQRRALAEQQRALVDLRAAYEREVAEMRGAQERSLAEVHLELGAARELFAQLRAAQERAHAQTLDELEAIRSSSRQQSSTFDAKLDEKERALRNEMTERIERILEEQRVCYRQLSLEASETAVMHDRARRELEARLSALENVQSDEARAPR